MRKESICVTAPEQPKAVLSELVVAAGKCDCELNNAADTAAAFEMEAREFFQRLIDTIKEEKAHGKQGI